MKREGTSRVTWEIEPVGDSCRLTVTHDQLREGANGELYGGWPMILSGLKTLLETGELLTTPGSLRYNERSPDRWSPQARRAPRGVPRGPGSASGGAAAQQRDELRALALGEAADGLARRDPALLQDLVGLHAAVLGDGEQHVEDLGGLEVLRRLSSSRSIERDRPCRSRLSCARWVRMSFARCSASMRCTCERSGAAGLLGGSMSVAGGTWRRHTHSLWAGKGGAEFAFTST